MLKRSLAYYLLAIPVLLLVLAIGHGIQRYETLPLFACYFSLFIIFILVVRRDNIEENEVNFWLIASVVYRTVLLVSIPALSDDFYRFIWDGRLLDAGYHPFAQVPSWYMAQSPPVPGLDAALYEKLNSKETFTIYPPFAQWIFWLSVRLSTGSVFGSMLVMKLIIFGFEVGTILLMRRLLRHFHLPASNLLFYALNPLVILEVTGNLHFEGIMIFFLMLAIHFLVRKRLVLSSMSYALSICTKLIPLLFLPLLFRQLGGKKASGYWVFTAVFTLILFLPLLNADIIAGMATSLGYYFQRFEFNASLYYLVRSLGYLVFGFNIIQYAGPVLAVGATVIILTISFRLSASAIGRDIDTNTFEVMLWCMLVYLLSTAILHPWYILTLLAISLFTPYRFPVLWTGLIFLTYAGYSSTGFQENLLLVAIEYIAVFAYLLYETVWKKQKDRF